MPRYLIGRAFHAMVVLVAVSAVAFFIIHLAPGGPSILTDPRLTPEQVEMMRHNLGLDQPIHVQYTKWLSRILHGDLGRSFLDGQPVLALICSRMPATLLLAASTLVVAVIGGILLGAFSAIRAYSLSDSLISVVSFIAVSVPSFWQGIVLILIFSVWLPILPSAGMYTIGTGFSVWDRLAHLLMPTLVLGTFTMAIILRYTRTSLVEVLREEYITTARAKGLSERLVLYRHALRNALLPVVTTIGLMLPPLIGGSAIVETIFAWPGIGRLAVDSALGRNYPVVMGITVIISVVVVIVNLLVDVLYAYIDPRIRLG
jgi:peptide/nickel transport system permease protein